MKFHHFAIGLTLVAAPAVRVRAQIRVTSWYTENSGQYARLYESNTDLAAGNAVTTWSRGQGVQSSPTYAGIHEISVSADWVYIRTTGLAGYPMGPWYLNAADTQNFPNFPANTSTLFRLPLIPDAPPVNKVLTGLGAIGRFVDGVAMFDSRDAFSYSNANGTDASPVNGLSGDGVWNRDAYVNEGVTFDSGNAHQAGPTYHYHANPPGLRFQLGDHVDYGEGTRTYQEKTTPPTHHSPIIGWVQDGYPVYGPYGLDDPDDLNSGIRRMVSGYRKRSITVRQILPAHAARDQGYTANGSTSEYSLPANVYGPDVSANFPVGRYLEDYEYLGDVGQVQGVDFDLDLHNGRWCRTPEFPDGTYAYFTSIEPNGDPRFPYNIGRTYFGNPTGGNANTINETVEIVFEGGPETREVITGTQSQDDGVIQTFTWRPVAGGTYTVESNTDLLNSNSWVMVEENITPTNDLEVTSVQIGPGIDQMYFRIRRDSLADFDDSGFQYGGGGGGPTPTDPGIYPDVGTRGTTIELVIVFDANITPPLPPLTAPLPTIMVGSLSATGIARPDQVTLTAQLVLPPGTATGPQNVVVDFPGPPVYTFANGFTIQ